IGRLEIHQTKVSSALWCQADRPIPKSDGRKACPTGMLGGHVTQRNPLVTVVDDNESVRESIPELLQSFGFEVAAFASAEAFLASATLGATDCLVLDVGLPGMSGPDLQGELLRRAAQIPIVFITAQADASLRPRVLARGACACLFKPFSDTELLDAVNAALE